MARPKKKPEYDSDQMAQQLMEAVTDAYLNPPQGTEDDIGHMQLKQLAEEFSIVKFCSYFPRSASECFLC